jgi:hypothetical protein
VLLFHLFCLSLFYRLSDNIVITVVIINKRHKTLSPCPAFGNEKVMKGVQSRNFKTHGKSRLTQVFCAAEFVTGGSYDE